MPVDEPVGGDHEVRGDPLRTSSPNHTERDEHEDARRRPSSRGVLEPWRAGPPSDDGRDERPPRLEEDTQWGCRSRTISSPSFSSFRGTARARSVTLGPAELGEPVVVDAEVVADLVDDRDPHLVAPPRPRSAQSEDRPPVDRDPVGHDHPVVEASRSVSGMPSYRPRSPDPGLPSATTTATLSMSRPSSSGMPSRASATSSSNRSPDTSTTKGQRRVARDGPRGAARGPRRRAAPRGHLPGAPLVVLAPAGSGKTRVLTRRIAHRVATGEADPRHVLALTFTRKAAGELDDRLAGSGSAATSPPGRSTRSRGARCAPGGRTSAATPPTLLDRKARLLARARPDRAGQDAASVAADLATEIEWAKARMIAPDDYAEAVVRPRSRRPCGRTRSPSVYAAYETPQAARRASSTSTTCSRLSPGRSSRTTRSRPAQRWRFRHLFVDELQDVNPLQFRLLEAWRGDRDDVSAVGDPQQAIYGWNGADAGFLLDIQRWWPTAEVVQLTAATGRRRRSSTRAAAVLAQRPPAGARRSWPPCRRARRAPAAATTTTGPRRSPIARAVRLAHAPGRPWREQAVLVRTHAQTPCSRRRSARPASPTGSGAARRSSTDPSCAAACATSGRPGPARHRARRPGGGSRRDGPPRPLDLADDPEGAGAAADARRRGAALGGCCRWAATTCGSIRWAGPQVRALARRHRAVRGRRHRRTAATRSSSPPSTPPRASSGRSCTSPGSRTGSCRSPTPAPQRPRPRRRACCTSR